MYSTTLISGLFLVMVNSPIQIRLPATASEVRNAGFEESVSKMLGGKDIPFIANLIRERFRNEEGATQFVTEFKKMSPSQLAQHGDVTYLLYTGSVQDASSTAAWQLFVPLNVRQDGNHGEQLNQTNVVEFLSAFAGSRTSLKYGGGFLPALKRAETMGEGFESSRAKWQDAYIAFHAENGDLLVVHPGGEAGWLVLETSGYEPIGEFSVFVDSFWDMLRSQSGLNYWGFREAQRSREQRR